MVGLGQAIRISSVERHRGLFDSKLFSAGVARELRTAYTSRSASLQTISCRSAYKPTSYERTALYALYRGTTWIRGVRIL